MVLEAVLFFSLETPDYFLLNKTLNELQESKKEAEDLYEKARVASKAKSDFDASAFVNVDVFHQRYQKFTGKMSDIPVLQEAGDKFILRQLAAAHSVNLNLQVSNGLLRFCILLLILVFQCQIAVLGDQAAFVVRINVD